MLKYGYLFCAVWCVTGCHESFSEAEKQFAESVLANMVPIQGGSYKMGDFIGNYPVGGVPNDKPIHTVQLADFKMGAYLTTWVQYEQYAQFRGLPVRKIAKDYENMMSVENRNAPTMPASVTWDDAHAYCQWLGKVTNQQIDLPTEAQWEYVARNRGQQVVFPTDNGQFEWGRNVDENQYAAPVGTFPPNPLGIYDLVTDGTEWMFDWYDKKYYEYSQTANPAGPFTGTLKATRSYHGQNPDLKVTTIRGAAHPSTQLSEDVRAFFIKKNEITIGYNFRCVVHTAPLVPNDRPKPAA